MLIFIFAVDEQTVEIMDCLDIFLFMEVAAVVVAEADILDFIQIRQALFIAAQVKFCTADKGADDKTTYKEALPLAVENPRQQNIRGKRRPA